MRCLASLVRLALVLILANTFACARRTHVEHQRPEPQQPAAVYVSPVGSDHASGTLEAPFRTLRHALEANTSTVVLLPGLHPDDVNLGRPVSIRGASGRRAILTGHVFVRARGVELRALTLLGGLSASFSEDLTVASASVAPGQRDDALSLTRSRAHLSDLDLRCGGESCLAFSTSTVSLERASLRADPSTKRALRSEASQTDARSLRIRGGSFAQLQAGQGSQLSLRDAELEGGRGHGITALGGSRVEALRVRVKGTAKSALLVQSSTASIAESEFQAARTVTAAFAGANVELQQTQLFAGPEGALTLNQHAGRPSRVHLIGGKVHHGAFEGVLVGGSILIVDGTHFIGTSTAPVNDRGGNAITAHGIESNVEVRSARIDAPTGAGVSLTGDAAGTITATISQPGVAGVFTEDVAAAAVKIDRARIEGCRSGSAIVLLGTSSASVTRSQLLGSSEAGILTGARSTVRVEKVRATNNHKYGFAAFGGSNVMVRDSESTGSKWSTYASCGDDASVLDGGKNHFDGPVASCP